MGIQQNQNGLFLFRVFGLGFGTTLLRFKILHLRAQQKCFSTHYNCGETASIYMSANRLPSDTPDTRGLGLGNPFCRINFFLFIL
jgi:hypothetical protein